MQEINFTYNSGIKFLRVVTYGCLYQADLLKLVEELPKFYRSDTKLNVILNFCQSTLHICTRELNSFIETVRKKKMPDRNIRIANLVCSSRETALAMLFKEEADGINNLDFEVFSTESAALDWLHLN